MKSIKYLTKIKNDLWFYLTVGLLLLFSILAAMTTGAMVGKHIVNYYKYSNNTNENTLHMDNGFIDEHGSTDHGGLRR